MLDEEALDRIEAAIHHNLHANRYYPTKKEGQEDLEVFRQLRREHAELTAELSRLRSVVRSAVESLGNGHLLPEELVKEAQ